MLDDVLEMMQDNDAIILFQSINQFILILSIYLRNVPDDVLEMLQVMMLSYCFQMYQMMYQK